MAFKQLKDLIEWITQYHEMLEKQYKTLTNNSQAEALLQSRFHIIHTTLPN